VVATCLDVKMPTIGIVDDRDDQRQTLSRFLATQVAHPWEVIDTAPLSKKESFTSWITEHEVSVLLLDERLNERQDGKRRFVAYRGHELVEFLRKTLPNLPIYVVTSYPDDADLKERFKDVEDIIERRQFYEKAGGYIPRMLRSAQKFLEAFRNELETLARGAERMAVGKASVREIQQIKAIQTKLSVAFPTEYVENRQAYLSKIEANVKQLLALKQKLEHIRRKK